MYRPVLQSIFLVTIFLLSFYQIHAHETNSNGSLEATIHVSPDDLPVAQQPSKIQVKVKDSANLFDFSRCLCILEVSHDTTSVAELPLQGDGTTLETNFTFADAGEYTLKFTGQNINTDTQQFTPFELTYSYVVKSPSPQEVQEVNVKEEVAENNNIFISAGGIILSALAVISILVIIRKKSHH